MKIKAAAAALIIAALAACSGGQSPTPPAPTPIPVSQISLTTFNGVPIVATPAHPFVDAGFSSATVFALDPPFSGQVTIKSIAVTPAACGTASIGTQTSAGGSVNTLTIALTHAAGCTASTYEIDVSLTDPSGAVDVVVFVLG